MSILPQVLTDGTAENIRFVNEPDEYIKKQTFQFDFNAGEFITDPMRRCKTTQSTKAFLQETVEKILSDDRFKYIIYTDAYGNEARHILSLDLPAEILVSELRRAYTEALVYHPLIDRIMNFTAEVIGDVAHIQFTVVGIRGDEIVVERREAF